ncbi:MAG: RNA polymerase factor sigma-54 [Paramuribaculum sp.]|nr:RNA polymerase factor sigma-54 [Paramuribaculum sp.]
MKEALTTSLSQTQLQTLSPMQMQFVHVLEMTGPELEDEVRRVLDENPALEVADADEFDVHQEDDFNESPDELQMADYGSEDEIPHYRLEARNYSPDSPYYEPVAVVGETLIDNLQNQLAEHDLSDDDRLVAGYIIGSIDSNGYMTRSVAEITNDLAFQEGVDVSIEDVRRIWQIVRSLEPSGIGAVDLRDCLLLQLKRLPNTHLVELAVSMVGDYFDLFSRMRYDRLRQALGVTEDELKSIVDLIRTLNPKPGSAFAAAGDDERLRQISPDFAVECEGSNITITSLNRVPRLQIESSFSGDIHVPQRLGDNALKFVRQRRDEAQNFIQVLDMRNTTLYRVMTAIVKLQREFFESGDVARIRPMILRDVAELTGYDLSVISRATTGKYVATSSGVYPLKYFFNERPVDGADASSHELLEALKSVIDSEDKQHPLSDRAITDLMNQKGYAVARRTVTKYREKAGIPVGRLRRKM